MFDQIDANEAALHRLFTDPSGRTASKSTRAPLFLGFVVPGDVEPVLRTLGAVGATRLPADWCDAAQVAPLVRDRACDSLAALLVDLLDHADGDVVVPFLSDDLFLLVRMGILSAFPDATVRLISRARPMLAAIACMLDAHPELDPADRSSGMALEETLRDSFECAQRLAIVQATLHSLGHRATPFYFENWRKNAVAFSQTLAPGGGAAHDSRDRAVGGDAENAARAPREKRAEARMLDIGKFLVPRWLAAAAPSAEEQVSGEDRDAHQDTRSDLKEVVQ